MAEKWLVIDDSATIQRVIKLAFQDYDVTITEAESCQEALRELGLSPSKLVIADAALAGVQSVHDFSRLRQVSPDSAFVILEGSYDHIDEAQFRGAGFRHFLKKPFDAAQLIAITREALGRAIPHRQSETEDMAPFLSDHSNHPEESHVTPPAIPTARIPSINLSPSFEMEDDEEEDGAPPLNGVPYVPDHAHREPPMAEPFASEKYTAKPYNPEQTEGAADNAISVSPFNLDADAPTYRREKSYAESPLSGVLQPMLQEEMAHIIRQTVEEYCRMHFGDVARELVLKEIDKLTQERSRLLVDK